MISATGEELTKIGISDFIKNLSKDIVADEGQILAWKNTYEFITDLILLNPNLEKAVFVFEYHIPFTDANRTDILMFIRDTLYIIEFKNRSGFKKEDIEQLSEYFDQINFYHSESYKYNLKPILLLKSGNSISKQEGEMKILSTSEFIDGWKKSKVGELAPTNSVQDFLNGHYYATVDITNFAQRYLNDNPLPGIKHPLLEKSNKVLDKISEFIEEARSENLHTLILLTGEAGAGKTAIALQLYAKFNGAYITKNNKFYKLLKSRINHHSNIFTSTSVIREYIEKRSKIQPNVVLIDEAQRTWDERRIKDYFKSSIDEHSILLSHILGKPWSTTIAFIGVEQELASSETSYMDEWFEAFTKYASNKNSRRLYCSFLIEEDGEADEVFKLFHLDCNLRSNIERKLSLKHSLSQVFCSMIEDPNNAKLINAISKIKQTGYKLIITRNLDSAVSYVKCSTNSKVFPTGIIGTPEIDGEEKYTFLQYQDSKNVDINCYLLIADINQKRLKELALTQYDSLGFEFDIPIIHWNIDYTYFNDQWNYEFLKSIEGQGLYYVRNAYKVLLTRGRTGIILYFPGHWKFNKTYDYFRRIGFDPLT